MNNQNYQKEEIKFGDVTMFLPRNTESIALARRLLDMFEEEIDPEERTKAEDEKTSKNVHKRIKNTFKKPDQANIDNLLITAFDHDRKLKSSYKTLFFTETDDGTVLSYSGTKLYVRREKVLELPHPVPHGYFGHVKSGTPANRATAIRFYRAYLAEQKPSETEQKPPELKSPISSGKNNTVILLPFTEAERFDYSNLRKNTIERSIFYENPDGRMAIKYSGYGDIVFITKEQASILKKMDTKALNEYLDKSKISDSKQFVIKKYIEGLKDVDIGAIKILSTDTRGSHED